ncbi:unnamed protein product [Rotaria sordida]|uniref:G-protein coupled receptors family 1 profile domain-containing protein n=1 Tax=Rotaria sordida TaxID=392033 RepID=A0A814HM83_9BILA|nr:unnamed protein product [Rotaria sordida]CAF3693723.1 unnamed protein product [Rotaria sordida]CAF3855575.1 unnamed protein product [Rotaria sordida]
MVEYQDSSSTLEKLTLLVYIIGIVIGHICIFLTFIGHADRKHWSNIFILGMAFIDLFIGGFVLPMRFINAYGNPSTQKLCTALKIGESCALAAVIYSILFMIYTRLYSLKQPSPTIRRHYLLLLLLISWIILFLFYGIPFMTNYSHYLLPITSNTTSYCTPYITSIYHPLWMSYTEIGIIYSLPLIFIFIGLIYLLQNLCHLRSRRLKLAERSIYIEQRQMTWHIFLLGITFIFLYLPWISIRILIIFLQSSEIRLALQITYYILILKSLIFPLIYASTNASFRCSFAIYRRQRIIMNNRVWTINEQFR